VHSSEEDVDTGALWRQLRKEITLIPEAENANPAASFGHIMGGYAISHFGRDQLVDVKTNVCIFVTDMTLSTMDISTVRSFLLTCTKSSRRKEFFQNNSAE
jgi:hypothetical protein